VDCRPTRLKKCGIVWRAKIFFNYELNYEISLVAGDAAYLLEYFMTFARHGHFKFKNKPLLLVIIVSWGIAFFEYCFQVPANRRGNSVYSPFPRKVIQEISRSRFLSFLHFFIFTKNFGGIMSRRLFVFWPPWRLRSGQKIRRGWKVERPAQELIVA
jgi:uncharacterized protein (DUF486 family)